MVANVALRQSIPKLRLNQALVGSIITLLLALAFCRQAHLVTSTGFATSPQILMQKARELITLAGFVENPVDVAFSFADRSSFTFGSRPERSFELGSAASPAPLLFLRAAFTNPLDIDRGLFPFAIASSESFEVERGQLDSITVALAPDARLMLFDASTMKTDFGRPAVPRREWADWIRDSGLETVTMTPSLPLQSDRGALACATDRISFNISPSSGVQTGSRIEGASRDGRVIFFAVMRETASEPFRYWSDPTLRRSIISSLRNNVFLLLLAAAIPAAWRNLRSRGADTAGATRLAIGIVLLKLCADILATRYLPNFPDEFNRITLMVFNALGEGLIVAIFYIALERHVRRDWPHTLIGWSRLLEGRLRDPYIGFNLLAGCVVGPLWATLIAMVDLVPRWMQWTTRTPLRLAGEFQYLLGARFALASCCDWIRTAIYLGLLLLSLLVLTRIVLRPTAAAIVTWLIASCMYVPGGSHPLTGWLFFGCVGALAILVLIRFGLVSFIAAVALTKLLLSFPFTIDPNAWYAEYGMFALAAPLALALFGYMQAFRRAGPIVRP
jgi:hypothetical protein